VPLAFFFSRITTLFDRSVFVGSLFLIIAGFVRRLLVLLILGAASSSCSAKAKQGVQKEVKDVHKILAIALSLRKLHLIHALVEIPVQESTTLEHCRELRGKPL
jgi:hypothetical protein